MRRGRVRAAVLLVAALTAGCAGGAAGEPRWRPGGSEPASSSPSVPPESAAPAELTLAFAGDVHFTGRTLALLDEPATAFGKISSTLSDADLTIVNLETAVTGRGTPEPKRFHFRAPKTAYAALRSAGIDAASVANNHTLDYGQVGLLDTLSSASD